MALGSGCCVTFCSVRTVGRGSFSKAANGMKEEEGVRGGHGRGKDVSATADRRAESS